MPPFVAKASLRLFTSSRLPSFPSVKQLNLPLPPFLFPVSDNPDVSPNSGVVEHLFWQSNDALKPILLNNPSAYIAFPRACPPCEKRRTTENNRQSGPIFLLLWRYFFKLAHHVLQKKQRSIVDAWQARPKASVIAPLIVFLLNLFLLLLPI